MEAKLAAKSQGPVQCMLHCDEGYVGSEYFQEVVEIVTDKGWEMPLQDPVQRFSKEVEDI